jgi:ubiquinone/menaquinone biosynthesis C-methylase UbiE
MPSFDIMRTVVRELLTRQSSAREPEPDLIMDDPDKVAAFTRAGLEDGVMAPVYLFHTAHISDVLRPGDTVVDLGCGPAVQLAMVARLNPETEFIGVDLSDPMLDRARSHAAAAGVDNVRFQRGDITALDFLGDASVDAVISTVVLHHLPDRYALDQTFAQVARILKPGGGIYLVDFSHLKSERSISYFAHQYADRQDELFTLDYLYSLRAAFFLSDFKTCHATHLAHRAKLYSMRPMPFMVAVKSPARRSYEPELKRSLAQVRDELPPHHKSDVRDLITLFGFGGMRTSFL